LAAYIRLKDKDNMLDIEAILQQFELIEQKVEHVVQARETLEKENEELNNKIRQLETLIQDKIEAEKKNEELIALVRDKIDRLIGRLEGTTEEKNTDLRDF
jgi:protein-arginine kinase activator protein McsA